MGNLRVSETYGPVIQGEGPVCGRPTIFVRMSGCDYRCDWSTAPWVPIRMANGGSRQADRVSVSDAVIGYDRQNKKFVDTQVTGKAWHESQRFYVKFGTGREMVVGRNHEFCTGKQFQSVQEINTGDTVVGLRQDRVKVEMVSKLGSTEVVGLTTEAGTIVTGQIVSKNCDTKYAVEPDLIEEDDPDSLSAQEIVEQVQKRNIGDGSVPNGMTVTFSGGNPALFDLGGSVRQLEEVGYETIIETQGSVTKNWFQDLSHLVLSPKGPSAGEHPGGNTETPVAAIQDCITASQDTPAYLKVVCFNEQDYEYAKRVFQEFPETPHFLQAGTIVEDADWKTNYQWLCERVLDDPEFDKNVKILPQLHVAAFGGGREV